MSRTCRVLIFWIFHIVVSCRVMSPCLYQCFVGLMVLIFQNIVFQHCHVLTTLVDIGLLVEDLLRFNEQLMFVTLWVGFLWLVIPAIDYKNHNMANIYIMKTDAFVHLLLWCIYVMPLFILYVKLSFGIYIHIYLRKLL